MSCQPTLDDLNAQRIADKVLDLAALGWVIESHERRGLPVPTTYDEIHQLANDWKAKP